MFDEFKIMTEAWLIVSGTVLTLVGAGVILWIIDISNNFREIRRRYK